MGRLPNLYIPGFQKCATCTLFESLIKHPEVSAAKHWGDLSRLTFPKEIHFFDKHFDRGLEFLESMFDGASERYLLDGSPNYIAAPGVFERVIEAVPDARFIVSMRDPAQRAVSAWNHWSQLELHEKWPVPVPSGTFEENLIADAPANTRTPVGGSLLGLGCYASHIEEAFKLASREQFHFLFLEDLHSSFEEEMLKVFHFLELNSGTITPLHVHRRKHTVEGVTPQVLGWLRDYYRDEDDKLSELLHLELPWKS